MLTRNLLGSATQSVYHEELGLFETTVDVSKITLPSTDRKPFAVKKLVDCVEVDLLFKLAGKGLEYMCALMEITIVIKRLDDGYHGSYCLAMDGTSTITIEESLSQDDKLSTLIHELQHFYQAADGRNGGSNMEEGEKLAREMKFIPRLVAIFKREHRAFLYYQNNAGEIEARLAQARNHLTVQELRTRPMHQYVKFNKRYFN